MWIRLPTKLVRMQTFILAVLVIAPVDDAAVEHPSDARLLENEDVEGGRLKCHRKASSNAAVEIPG